MKTFRAKLSRRISLEWTGTFLRVLDSRGLVRMDFCYGKELNGLERFLRRVRESQRDA